VDPEEGQVCAATTNRVNPACVWQVWALAGPSHPPNLTQLASTVESSSDQLVLN